ncbi:MAG TPA: ABATE domain-containing protein [Roseomonas sp.]|nr:ABATE domain-containing protein [Roseomonas sp.]
MTIRSALPHRVAGDLALDFANTISWRGTPRETDHLADGDAILAWAKEMGLVEPGFAVPDGGKDALVRDAHRLRDAITAAAGAIALGTTSPAPALATIRDLAARSLAAASLTGAPAQMEFTNTDRILGPLAWAALDLLRGGELGRLKRCPSADCHWLFVDRTKNGSRRWCDMATCGDRAKKRRHRSFQDDPRG